MVRRVGFGKRNKPVVDKPADAPNPARETQGADDRLYHLGQKISQLVFLILWLMALTIMVLVTLLGLINAGGSVQVAAIIRLVLLILVWAASFWGLVGLLRRMKR